uniref:sperm head and tail associated protein-like n=1 Tax=Macaca mulatta TaxID=9544 RepID=UPI0007328190|nr:sperm head and tail associated protein-like [Macaca mulatta]
MTSPPFLIDFPARSPSPLGKYHSDLPCTPGSPPPCRKGFSPFLNLELPLATGKGYSDDPARTAGPNPGKRCNESSHPLESPCFSRDPFSCLPGSPGISSMTGTPPYPPQPMPSRPPPSLPPAQPSLQSGRCSFESSSPLPERTYCREPWHSGSPLSSPYFEQFSIPGSSPLCQRTPYCSWMSPSRMRRACVQGAYFDQRTNLCYSSRCPSAFGTSPATSFPLAHQSPGTSPVTSPQLTHVPLETGPMISPPPTHRTPGTCLTISPPLARRPVETSPMDSSTPSHRVLETGLMISLPSHWSSGRSYNDPLLSPAPSPPTGSFYCGSLRPLDSCEPKPQLDLPLEKNCCGSPLSSQAGRPGFPRSLQDGSYHYSHLSSEAYMPTPGSPCYAIRLHPRSTDSAWSPQSQAPRKACFESVLSWEPSGNSYLILTPGTTNGPPCSQEPSRPHGPHSVLSFPSPLGNQFISPPQSLPRRSYNEPPLPTPVSPQPESPKSPELRQSHTPHKCLSLVNTPQHTPSSQPKPTKARTSPPPPSCLSGPSCMEPYITTPSNSSPKELPPGTALPTVVRRTLKTVIPTSLPLSLPCDPVSPNSYAQSSPHGPSIGPPCNTHIYSVVPSTPHPCPLSGSLNHSKGPPPIVPRCDTYSTPRGPPQPRRQPVMPPCSTHIYSFIPLRTPFDPRSLPIVPRVRAYPDTVPCGLHIYPVASQGPCKEPLQIPYSCPLPSSKDSSCNTNPSCSSTIIRECQSSDSESRSSHQSQSRSQSKSS